MQARDKGFELLVKKFRDSYVVGKDRTITPKNVYQPAVNKFRELLHKTISVYLLPGSKIEGLENLDDCFEKLAAKQSVLWLPEHRGNMDVTSFYVLLEREHPRYQALLEKLVYVAGRKLNELSELVNMFTEQYSRLVVVPRRDLLLAKISQFSTNQEGYQRFLKDAQQINLAAFRQLLRIRNRGYVVVLFPLGGRWKPNVDNVPVRETISYMERFDWAYPISMDGNTMPTGEKMEDERPVHDKVVFRVGKPLNCREYLADRRKLFDEAHKQVGNQAGENLEKPDFEQHTANEIIQLLEQLRTTGDYQLV